MNRRKSADFECHPIGQMGRPPYPPALVPATSIDIDPSANEMAGCRFGGNTDAIGKGRDLGEAGREMGAVGPRKMAVRA